MTRYLSKSGSNALLYGGLTGANDNPHAFGYSLWLAGYWEDFSGAYAVPESESNKQEQQKSHFGNPMNAEARLNPYYRWSYPDRKATFGDETVTLPVAGATTIKQPDYAGWVTSNIKSLHNLGSHEHLTIDSIRMAHGTDYMGILNNQYADSNAHTTRFKFGGEAWDGTTETSSFMLLNPSMSEIGRYYIHAGDTDSTNGRIGLYQPQIGTAGSIAENAQVGNFSTTTYNAHGFSQLTGTSYLIASINSEYNRAIKRVVFNTMTSTAGRFNFEALQSAAYGASGLFDPASGQVAWARGGYGVPHVISADIVSPSGTPFLVCQQTFPANQIIAGQVFAGNMGASFPSGTVGGVDGEWTSGDLTYSAPGATGTGTDYREYTDLRVGDIVEVAAHGQCIIQAVDHDNKTYVVRSVETGLLLNPGFFNPADGDYLGLGAALDTVPMRRFLWPLANFNGPLNTRSNGDVFHMRFCPQHLNLDGLPNDDRSLHYIIKLGYRSDRLRWTESGNRYEEEGLDVLPSHYNACVEIDLRIGDWTAAKSNDDSIFNSGFSPRPQTVDAWDVASGVGASNPTKAEAYVDYDGTGTVTAPNYSHKWQQWVDLDVVFNFTDQRYQVFIDGIQIGAYDMMSRPGGGAWVADELWGWHIDSAALLTSYSAATNIHTYDGGQKWTAGEPQYLATLIDRVGIIHEVTNPVADIGASSIVEDTDCLITQLDVSLVLDRSGTIDVSVEDDDNTLHLQRILKNASSDWKMLLFKDGIDDVYWVGELTGLNIQQKATERGKMVSIDGADAITSLERVLPYWEVGASAYTTSDTYVYRRDEAEMNTENFYLGARRLLRGVQALGLDHAHRTLSRWDDATEVDSVHGDYAPRYEQRMRLYSGNPIQMYSGEGSDGNFISLNRPEWKTSPTIQDWRDNVVNMWSTRRIIGFSDGTHLDWVGQDPQDRGRGIIAHCIEHGLKVGDNITLAPYVAGSMVNPFTWDEQTSTPKIDVSVKKVIDRDSFLFVYESSNITFGPDQSEAGSWSSVIRRERIFGGLGRAGEHSFLGNSVTGNSYADANHWLTQIAAGAYSQQAGPYRFEIDGRLISSAHSARTVGAGEHDLAYDRRSTWFHYDFASKFHKSPWSGIGLWSYSDSITDVTNDAADSLVDYTTFSSSAWAKYRDMNFKPAAVAWIGCNSPYLYSNTDPSGITFGYMPEDHHNLMTVGPAYWMASNVPDNQETGLAYLDSADDRLARSQVFTMISVHPVFEWDGSIDGRRRPYNTASQLRREGRMALMLRGNDIDPYDPKMPTTDNPASLHSGTYDALTGETSATQNTRTGQYDTLSWGHTNSTTSSMHEPVPRLYMLDAVLASGVAGTSSARWDFTVNTGHASQDSRYNDKKHLIPRTGEFRYNTSSGYSGYVLFTYENFDPATDTFTGCQIPLSAQQVATAFPHSSLGLQPCIHIVASHAQAVFIPPSERAAKSRNRASHALWMEDIRSSLWFKMVFGVIGKNPVAVHGPPRGYMAIKGASDSPHNTQSDAVPFAQQGTDYFELTADIVSGATSITIEPHCAIPMTTPDGQDHRYLSTYGSTTKDVGTDPFISIPSKAFVSSGNARKNAGLIFEIERPDGSIDVGIADEAVMVNCKDTTDPAYTHWEIVEIRQDTLRGFEDTLEGMGISHGVNTPGPLWVKCAYYADSYFFGGSFTGAAPTQDPDYYGSGNPAAVSGLQGFSNISVGDVIFLGNTQGAKLMPPTDDANRRWNPNNPTGDRRDLVSYRWYVVLDKSTDETELCIFPAEYAYTDEDTTITARDGSTVYPLRHTVAHSSASSHKLQRGSGSNPYSANLPPSFPAQSGPVICKLYCGDVQLNNVKFTQHAHEAGAIGRFRQVRDDFRHIYILWADMRNDGSADADNGTRRENFGLIYPTSDNYEVHVVHGQTQEDLVELKLNEDVDLWTIGSTDPYTGNPWSDNITNNINGDFFFSDFMHDWEGRAGSFLIVDTSKFFNLNTYGNNGRIGQIAGGSKTLSDITVQSEGFPELIDSYWWWVMPHPATAKYRHPYDPTWKSVCKYRTVVASDVDAHKPLLVIDSSPYYMGSLFDEGLIEGTFSYTPNSNEEGQTVAGTVDGTWIAAGSFVTHYDEMGNTDAKRLYINVGSRIKDANQADGLSMALTETNDHTAMGDLQKVNDNEIHMNWAAANSLSMMLAIDGYVEAPSSNTFYEHDKVRVLWQNGNRKVWLTGSRVGIPYDIDGVPIAKSFDTTHQGTTNTAEIDSFGGVVDGRGKTVLRILNQAQADSGSGQNGLVSKWHYHIERGRFVYRPAYSSFLTMNRDNLSTSRVSMSADKAVSFVRVFFNGGESFVDYPQPALADDVASSKWKMVDRGDVSSANEAHAIAVQTYESMKQSVMTVTGTLIRESGQSNVMDGGRHGYVATPCIRNLPSSSSSALSNTLHHWSETAGCLFPGRVDALDGNLDGLLYLNQAASVFGGGEQVDTYGDAWDELFIGAQKDNEYLDWGRGLHGSGTCDPASVGNSTDATYAVKAQQSYGFYGVGSVDKAIQVVHVPANVPLVSETTGERLRIVIAHNSNTAYEAKFSVYLIDPAFGTGASLRNEEFGSIDWSTHVAITNVQANGFIELAIPSSYGAEATDRIVASFNRDYCEALLKYRSHNATSALSGKGNRVDSWFTGDLSANWVSGTHSFNRNSTANAGSAFPLGLTDWAEVTSDDPRGRTGFNWIRRARALYYAPSLIITKDWKHRPGRLVTYTDSYIDINEEMMVNGVQFGLTGQSHESVTINLQRDNSESVKQGRGYGLPNLGDSYKMRPEPPAPPSPVNPPDSGSGGGSSSGSGGGGWKSPPAQFPPRGGDNGGSIGGGTIGNPLFPGSPSIGGIVSSGPSNASGRGNAIGGNMDAPAGVGAVGTHDPAAAGAAPIGRLNSTVAAPPQEGGFGIGATLSAGGISIGSISKSLNNALSGKADLLGEAGIEGASGILGVNRNQSTGIVNSSVSEVNAKPSSISAGNAQITRNGFTLPGRADFTEGVAQTDQDYHEVTSTVVSPTGAASRYFTIKAKVEAPATTDGSTTAKYTLHTTVTVVETGATLERSVDFNGSTDTIEVVLVKTASLRGISTPGNTLQISVGRSPNSAGFPTASETEGADNAPFQSIEVKGLRVYFETKNVGKPFRNTRTSTLQARDNSTGYLKGTVGALDIRGAEEGDGVADRTNEGSGQSTSRVAQFNSDPDSDFDFTEV